MTKNFRVFNVTRGYSLKRSQALRAIAECAAEWVEENISIRDLTLAESIAARNEQARLREPLALADMRHIRVVPPPGAVWSGNHTFFVLDAFFA